MYDVDGFMTSRTVGGATDTFDYSSRGELLAVNLANGDNISYDHDPMGRRVAKRINGTITEKYLWQDATTLLAVYDGTDNLLQRYEYADGRMPVAMTSSGQVYYFAYDQVGSLRAVTDATGVEIKRVDYDSFGNILADSNPTFTVPFGFAGGLHDRDTGLLRFGARDYDPTTGKWTAKDPIDFGGGDVNLYAYAINDPIRMLDVNGKASYRYEKSLIGDQNAGILNISAGVNDSWRSFTMKSDVEVSAMQIKRTIRGNNKSVEFGGYKFHGVLEGGVTNLTAEAAAKVAVFEGEAIGTIKFDPPFIDPVFLKFTLLGTAGSLGFEGKLGRKGIRFGYHAMFGAAAGLEWGWQSELPCE